MYKTGNRIQKLYFRKNKISYCIMQVLFVFLSLILFVQTASALESCYVASDSTDRLTFVVDRTDGNTAVDVGPFGASLIEALAKDPFTGVTYGANANQLGTINLDTGAFTARPSTFGTALAANGNLTADVLLSDIDALAFDLSTGFLYGVQNVSGPEILFRINPATGALIPGVMGGGNDYLLVNTTGSIDDLAIDQVGTMFASNAGSLYTVNFAATGTTSATLIGSFGGPNDMEGLSTDVPGNLIGSTGANNTISGFNNSIWTISKTTGIASSQVSIPIGGDYEGITCALANVDLSLTKTVSLTNDADTSGTITVGDEVTFSITVINNDANQIASGVEVTDDINTLAGLTFVSSSSTKATPNPYTSATGVWSVGVIPANSSYQLDLVYTIGVAASGNTITNIAEITQSANPDPDSEPNNDDGDQSEDDEDNASITVIGSPAITKSFTPDPINIGGVSTLTLTLTNPNSSALTAVTFTDTYPSEIINATPVNASSTCGGTLTAIDSGPSVSLNGGTIPASGSCTISVDVTSNTSGTHSNTTGVVSTAQAPDSVTASDDLNVNTAPTVAKSFSPNTIGLSGTSTLTITLGNTNTVAATLSAALVDTLPTAGNGDVVVAAVPNIGGTCSSGSISAVAGSSTITFANGAIIPAGGCTIAVDVTSATAGIYTNTILAGALQTNLGNNAAPASSSLTVSANPPPTVTKSFSPSSINAGGTSQLTIVLGNASASAITLTANMDDNLPIGVSATAVNAATTCTTASVDISLNTRVRYLSGATIPSGSCSIVVDVTSNTIGTVTNTIFVGALQTNVGSNANPASDNLTVTAGGGTPSCPSGQTLSTPTPNPSFAIAQTNVGVNNPSNALGVYSAAGSGASNANSANLRANDILRLEFADTLAQNSNVILSLARDNNNGRVNIAFSDDGINEDAQAGTFGNGGSLGSGTVDVLTHLAVSVPSDGYRYLIIRRLNGRNWVDGASYNRICVAPPTSDLSITKDDSSLTYTPGGTGIYTIVVTNNGPDDVTGATIADDLPNGVTMSSAWTCTPSSGSSTCNTAPSTTDPISIDVDIVNGDTITITVPVQFSADMNDYLP